MATDEQIAKEQRELWDRIQADIEPELSSIFEAVYLEIADRLEATGNPLPPDDLRQRIESALVQLWQRVIRESGEYAMESLTPEDRKYAWGKLETKDYDDSFWDQLLRLYLEQYGSTMIVRITEATRDQIRRHISAGRRSGNSLAQIVEDLRAKVPELSELRAHVIARTEVHTASQYASQELMKASRIPMVKRWVSGADSRTRSIAEDDAFDHRVMNDVVVDLDDVFLVPKKDGTREPLKFPGDPNGSAANVIMCRCVMTFKRKR